MPFCASRELTRRRIITCTPHTVQRGKANLTLLQIVDDDYLEVGAIGGSGGLPSLTGGKTASQRWDGGRGGWGKLSVWAGLRISQVLSRRVSEMRVRWRKLMVVSQINCYIFKGMLHRPFLALFPLPPVKFIHYFIPLLFPCLSPFCSMALYHFPHPSSSLKGMLSTFISRFRTIIVP